MTRSETGDTVTERAPARLIDRWFPVAAVDEACGTPAGSGRNEKALFTWFASRPIAQARAAVLGVALADDADRDLVDAAVREGDEVALTKLSALARGSQPKAPVVLDCFSGRGIIPLEAARLGLRAVGTDASPVAVLASRLLADWALRDWSDEPRSPFTTTDQNLLFDPSTNRLAHDVEGVLNEVGKRVREAVKEFYPPNPDGSLPWGTLWAITIPCDACGRRFPVIGSLVLRHPEHKRADAGQSLRLLTDEQAGTWSVEVIDGVPDQTPTFRKATGARGKVAQCPFACGQVHDLDTLKTKNRAVDGHSGQYVDEPLVSADLVPVHVAGRKQPVERKIFRPISQQERQAVKNVRLDRLEGIGSMSPVPDEPIPAGNEDTVRPSAYGFSTYGELMNPRQTLQFVETVYAIRQINGELRSHGLSEDYSAALSAYAAATMIRKMRRSTRGATLLCHGAPSGSKNNRVQTSDIFSNESKIPFEFDHFEAGPAEGPGTWSSISQTGLASLRAHLGGPMADARPGQFRRASATMLPWRDNTVDMVVTDPPYYNMIDYADVSDLFYVWLRRCLFDILPELFGTPISSDGLQDKANEIIVKRGGAEGEHRDRGWYEQQLMAAFVEMRRVLKDDGELVVVFGHSDPDAWRRLLGALRDAGFVVTSAWPARTEGAATGVASIRVTVTIGCRVAPSGRASATVKQVESEIAAVVKERTAQWERDGLALSDQLMASYGPAMEVVGRYRKVLATDGTEPDLDRFLAVGRRAVRDAQDVKVDSIPLDTFDEITRFAVFWLRAFGTTSVAKGEAVFHAQADELRLDDVRRTLLDEVKGSYRLSLSPAGLPLSDETPVFELVRVMASRWSDGATDAVADALAASERPADDQHLWAVVADIVHQLPESNKTAIALSQCQRNRRAIETAAQHRQVAGAAEEAESNQLSLDDLVAPGGSTTDE